MNESNDTLIFLNKHIIYSRINVFGIITEVSDALCNTSGYRKEELIGKPYNILFHKENSKYLIKNIWSVLNKNKKWSGNIKKRKKNSDSYWALVEIHPIYNNKEKKGYIIIRQDITKERESNNEQAFLLEQEKMKSLSLMISNIAHQWRQPLNIISLLSSTLKLDYELNKLDNSRLISSLNKIIEQTQYLSKTIDEMKDFIITDNTKKIKLSSFIKIIKDTFYTSDITFYSNISEKNDIITYPSLIHILNSMIDNSHELLIQRDVKTPWILINLKIKKESYNLTIEDNAQGVTENILPHIFEPYITSKHSYQGTGLSLFLAYKIISERLKGRIFVENTKNGAKFSIIIPFE